MAAVGEECGRAWRCASPVEEGASVGRGGDFGWTGGWLVHSGVVAWRERCTVAMGRRWLDIGQRAWNGRLRRASRSDGRGKLALAPNMDAACRKMSSMWAQVRRSGAS
jgi:hypothetical protein